MYADDVGLVAQAESIEEMTDILNEDLARAQKYFKSWFLIFNPNKRTAIVFHLNNRS
jgi:hypothetical protein